MPCMLVIQLWSNCRPSHSDRVSHGSATSMVRGCGNFSLLSESSALHIRCVFIQRQGRRTFVVAFLVVISNIVLSLQLSNGCNLVGFCVENIFVDVLSRMDLLNECCVVTPKLRIVAFKLLQNWMTSIVW